MPSHGVPVRRWRALNRPTRWSELLHQDHDGAGCRRSNEQRHVVFHRHVSLQTAFGGQQCRSQKLAIAQAVGTVEHRGQTVVAMLHDVLRKVGQIESRWASDELGVERRGGTGFSRSTIRGEQIPTPSPENCT